MNKIGGRFWCLLACANAGCMEEANDGSSALDVADQGDFESFPENLVIDDPELTFNQLSESISGFAGYRYNADGKVVVGLTDLAQSESAIDIVSELPVATEASDDGSAVDVITERADYSWSELFAWRAPVRRRIMDIEGVVSLSINVALNRIQIGVSNAEAANSAKDVLAQAGVPEQAAAFVTVDYPKFATHTLSNTIDPRIGGIRGYIEGAGACTIGFTARNSAGQHGFFSASHCSPEFWSVDNSRLYQPNASGTPLGFESEDPAFFFCGTTACRHSDAAFWTRSSGVSSTLGRVARTTWYTGSVFIDHGNPYFNVVGERAPTEGLRVDKMGYVSGWTYGFVTNTCCDINLYPGLRVLCTIQASAEIAEGDSGGPLFWWNLGTNNIRLMGLLSGYDSQSSYYSRISRIRSDFGSIVTN